jgi:hypothetical protein
MVHSIYPDADEAVPGLFGLIVIISDQVKRGW